MIIPTYTEEEILRELIFDYKIVKRIAKKIATAYLNKVKKRGGFIRETDFDSYTVNTVSKNVWNVEIEYDQTKKIPWLFRACCIVEGNKKTKDYYIVRGLNTDKPYYVKVTSHALKRKKERNKYPYPESLNLAQLACWTFEHRETAICLRYVDLKFQQVLMKFNDADEFEDMSYIVVTNRGTYYANRSPKGNFVFKTYISSPMTLLEWLNYRKGKKTKWSKEGELLNYMITLHQYYNKSLYDKEVLEKDLYTVFSKEEELEMSADSPVILLKN